MPVAQRRRAGGLAVIVLRRPDRAAGPDGDRPVHDHGGRRVAVVERGRIDDRLERRAGLAHRLRGAVELGLRIGEAADHRQHAAGMRVHRDEPAGDLRRLAQLVGVALLLLDEDHVAGLQHVRRRVRLEPLAVDDVAHGEAHVVLGDGAGLPLGDQLAGDLALRLQADRQALRRCFPERRRAAIRARRRAP